MPGILQIYRRLLGPNHLNFPVSGLNDCSRLSVGALNCVRPVLREESSNGARLKVECLSFVRSIMSWVVAGLLLRQYGVLCGSR